MDRSEFLRILKNDVSLMLGSGYDYQLKTVYKNNGIKVDAINISKIGDFLGKTFAIDYDGADGYDEIYNKAWYIVDNYEKSMDIDKDINKLLDWEKSKDLVTFTLVNLKANKERLEQMPHIVLSDLAMIFKISTQTEEGIITAWVDNDLLSRWNIDVNEIPEIARKNTMQKYPAIIGALDNAMESFVSDIEKNGNKLIKGLYLLSNEYFINGAAVIFYNGLLKSIAEELDSDLVLIPTSVNEMLVMNKDEDVNYVLLQTVLIGLNSQVTPIEKILSNNLYEYTRKDDKITQVTECDLEINNDLF